MGIVFRDLFLSDHRLKSLILYLGKRLQIGMAIVGLHRQVLCLWQQKYFAFAIQTRRKVSNMCSVWFLVLLGRNDLAMGVIPWSAKRNFAGISIAQVKIILLAIVSSMLLFEVDAIAEWPGLLGPTRNGLADSSSEISKSFSGTPKQIWKVEAGQGYAGPAVAGNDFVLFERIGESDRVRLLNLESGK